MRILLSLVLCVLAVSCKTISQEEVMSLKRTNTVLDIFSIADSLRPYLQEVPPRRFFTFTSVQDSTTERAELQKIAQGVANDYSAFNTLLLSFSGVLLDVKDTTLLQRLEELHEKQRKKDFLSYLIATQYERRHKHEKALEWVGKAIMLNPYVENYFVLKAHLFTRSKKNKEAVEDLERITTFTKEPWHYFYMSYLLNRNVSQNKGALVSLDSAIASLKRFQEANNITPTDSFDLEKQEQVRELADYEKEREELLVLLK